MLKADQLVELDVLAANLAAGTCVGAPASAEQQDLRRDRIDALSEATEGPF